MTGRMRGSSGVFYRGILFLREENGTLTVVNGRARLEALVDDCIRKCLTLADDATDDATDNATDDAADG